METVNTYRKEGKLAVRHMWIVVGLFTLADVICSIIVAAANSNNEDGFAGAAFTAIWSAILAVVFYLTGNKIVYGENGAPLMVGFVLGFAGMLAQLYFMLTCYFLVLGEQAADHGYTTASVDKAMGAFCFINMVIYAVFTIILGVHRAVIMSQSKPLSAYKQEYDPTISDDYGGDEEQV